MALRSLWSGLRRLMFKDRVERDLADEVDHFVQMAAAAHVRRGVAPAEAERLARQQMGGIEQVKESVRDFGWEVPVETVLRDARHAVRGLRRWPAFSVAATLTLALGIGATTAMFSVVHGVMLRPLPFPRGHELAMLWTDDPKRGLHRELTAYPTIADWQRLNQTFADLAYYNTARAVVRTRAGRERTRLAFASPNLFTLLGVPPERGRWLASDDGNQGVKTAVISHSLWQRRFAGDPGAVGQTLVLEDWEGDPPPLFHVVGIMPPDFTFPERQVEIWTDARTSAGWQCESSERFLSYGRQWTAIGRMRPGVTVSAARRDFAQISQHLSRIHGAPVAGFPGFNVAVVPLLESIAGRELQQSLWLLMGAVTVVLLIACGNVGNLLLARGASRQHELALRFALGATRARVCQQLLVEAVVLAIIGGVAGVLLATGTTRLLATLAAGRLPRVEEVTVDANVLAFAVAVSLASALLFGLLPLGRARGAETALRLREAAALGGTGHSRLMRSVLVTVQCTLAVTLLVGAGLLLRSLAQVRAVPAGFDPVNVLVSRVEFGRDSVTSSANSDRSPLARVTAMDAFLERLAADPAVEGAAFVDDLFITGQGNESVSLPGRASATIPAGQLAEALVSPDFFATLRVPLRLGRYPTRADTAAKTRALAAPLDASLSLPDKARVAVAEPVVVNDAFVGRFFGTATPLGERFCIDPTGKTYCFEIVGVVANMHRQGPEHSPIPEYYGAFIPAGGTRADLVVRTRENPVAAIAAIRRLVDEMFPGAVVARAATMDADFGAFTAQRIFHTWLLTGFALLALTLAATGIYGVVHYTAAQRMRELAVRVSIGARPRDLFSLVVSTGMRAPLAGIACGLLLAMAAGRVLAHLLFGIEKADVTTFAMVAATLSGVALAACIGPARRAARTDAISVLRLE
jgi:predicted permease